MSSNEFACCGGITFHSPQCSIQQYIAGVNELDILIPMISRYKHGPRGMGGPGDCDRGCIKCQLELRMHMIQEAKVRKEKLRIAKRIVFTWHMPVRDCRVKFRLVVGCEGELTYEKLGSDALGVTRYEEIRPDGMPSAFDMLRLLVTGLLVPVDRDNIIECEIPGHLVGQLCPP